jgi:hypothetical protein
VQRECKQSHQGDHLLVEAGASDNLKKVQSWTHHQQQSCSEETPFFDNHQ